jgi:hypothetical protein
MLNILLAVAVIMLTCSLVIGAGSSTAKAASKKGTKLIKIWVNEVSGNVVDVKLAKDSGPDQEATLVSPTQPAQYIGTILFYKTNPTCTIIYTGGYAWQVCW